MATLSNIKLKMVELVLGSFAEMERPYKGVDWDVATAEYHTPGFAYPDYYQRDFHGNPGGYMNDMAAYTYDPITARIILPNEKRVRSVFAAHVKTALGQTQPQAILDLGVGTGTATLQWRRMFPKAAITGIDLSPYMLVAAERKLAGQNVQLQQAQAEATGFADASFDMVTASYLFHEIPKETAAAVVREVRRVLKPGGLFAVFDGNQHSNVIIKTFSSYFPEPYIKEYLNSDLVQMCEATGFVGVHVRRYLALHQFLTAFRASV